MHRHHRRHRRFRGPRRLFWRVYVYGLLLLFSVTISVGVANHLASGGENGGARNLQVAQLIDEELSPLLDDPSALATKLDRIHRAFDADVAVYETSGRTLAHAGTTPPPLDDAPRTPRWIPGGAVVPLGDGRAYAIAHFQWQVGGVRWLLVPLFVLLALALVTFPLARNIARPIERITQAAQALGEGHLDVRTGVNRRDEVGALAAAFDHMAARLQRLVAGEKELRANVSHELRTPLSRMRVALEIAEEGEHDLSTMQKHLRGIRGDIEELEELVDQVLITARLDLAGDDELTLKQGEVDLGTVAARSAQRFEETHKEHELEVEAERAATLVGDAKLLKRVIDNLLENSAKYAAPEDGVILLTITVDAHAVHLTVSDRGVGVAPEDIHRLFEPFFRADSIRASDTKGVGLGLSLCKRVVEAHGGSIRAELRDGGGLAMHVTLPRSH